MDCPPENQCPLQMQLPGTPCEWREWGGPGARATLRRNSVEPPLHTSLGREAFRPTASAHNQSQNQGPRGAEWKKGGWGKKNKHARYHLWSHGHSQNTPNPAPNTRTIVAHTFRVDAELRSPPNALSWLLEGPCACLKASLVWAGVLTGQHWRWVFLWWGTAASWDLHLGQRNCSISEYTIVRLF